jgi:hypothetical protein
MDGFVVRKTHALEKAEQLEFAPGFQVSEHLTARKVLDTNDEVTRERPEA